MTVETIDPAPSEVASPSTSRGGAAVTLCFAAATFLGAFLLFLVQPLIAKFILPWFGGGAAVWTTCMLFFQTVLLVGYLYAHLGVSRMGTRGQAVVHVVLLLAAVAAALPAIVPADRWKPADAGQPIARILLLLAVTVGLPCVALAATSPLLHSWYSRIRPGAAVYRLFALSNFGSMLALLAYPFVVEPLLPRRTQALAWSIGLAAFAVLCAACAWLAARYAPSRGEGAIHGDVPPAGDVAGVPAAAAPPIAGGNVTRVILWLALPACASALLLGTTNAMTHDFAPVPFLWVLPLALYLLTFIIAFDHPRWYRRRVFGWLLPVVIANAVWLIYQNTGAVSLVLVILGFVLAMFVGCMVLHGELARLRPDPRHLTAYYLTIAAGGALGGLLVAVAAPLLLRSYSELQMAIWVCCFLAFLTPLLTARRMPAGVVGFMAIFGLMAMGPVLWVSSHRTMRNAVLRTSTRDFYGVLNIFDVESQGGKGVALQHGGTTHGHQFRRPSLRATPTTYYYPATGVGLVLGPKDAPPRRVGLVGLGGGTLAAYARKGDVFRFYELNPSVLRVAEDAFTYLPDARERGATVEVVLGDGRLALEREPDQQFDAIVLDAFSGDAIPVHLLTSEAFDLYRRHLKPDGVLCVHVSNHYLSLDRIVAAAAARLGWHGLGTNTGWDGDVNYPALWNLLTPDATRADQLRASGAKNFSAALGNVSPWTDENANLMKVIHWGNGDDQQ